MSYKKLPALMIRLILLFFSSTQLLLYNGMQKKKIEKSLI